MKKIFGCLLILLFCGTALASSDQTGTNPGNFLKLGGGVRPIALGNAYTALADDLGSIYWNPAGLSKLKAIALSSTYTSWLADMSYSNISFAFYDRQMHVNSGLSLDYVNAGAIEETTAGQPYGTGRKFTPAFIALTAPFAVQPLSFLSFGLNIKALFDSIDTSEAIGYAFDAGALWDINDNISAGFCARNLAGSLSNVLSARGTAKNSVPANYALGICYRLPFLNLDLDYDLPADNQGFFCLGAEYVLNDTFFGRIGFSTRSEENAGGNLGAGLGLKFGILRLDYAYAPYGDLGVTHRISLGLFFPEGKPAAPSSEAGAAAQEAAPIPPAAEKEVPAKKVKSPAKKAVPKPAAKPKTVKKSSGG